AKALAWRAHALEQTFDAQPIGIKERTAAIARKSVSGEPHDVDVRRARNHALVDDLRAFVDHAQKAALDDLGRLKRATLDAALARILDQHGFDRRIGQRSAAAWLVAIPARARFLPESLRIDHPVEQI